jgi:hypothetical protein
MGNIKFVTFAEWTFLHVARKGYERKLIGTQTGF